MSGVSFAVRGAELDGQTIERAKAARTTAEERAALVLPTLTDSPCQEDRAKLLTLANAVKLADEIWTRTSRPWSELAYVARVNRPQGGLGSVELPLFRQLRDDRRIASDFRAAAGEMLLRLPTCTPAAFDDRQGALEKLAGLDFPECEPLATTLTEYVTARTIATWEQLEALAAKKKSITISY